MTKWNELKTMHESYADSMAPRMFIQTIPFVGAALDTLMAGQGTQIQQDRFYALIDVLAKRLDELEEVKEIEPSEELFDLFRIAIENSLRTRSEDKRERFANIIANTVTSDSKPWDEAETAMRLLGELEDIHINILFEAIKTHKVIGNTYDGLKAVTLKEVSNIMPNYKAPLNLIKALPIYKTELIQLGCIELVSKGLLNDIGSSGWDINIPLPTFVASDLAYWLVGWISNEENY